MSLRDLYEHGELTNAIARVVEDDNHEFTVKVLTRTFKSHDLGRTKHNLMSAADPSRRTSVLGDVDLADVLEAYKTSLEIVEVDEAADWAQVTLRTMLWAKAAASSVRMKSTSFSSAHARTRLSTRNTLPRSCRTLALGRFRRSLKCITSCR